jgi:hypothetical protein
MRRNLGGRGRKNGNLPQPFSKPNGKNLEKGLSILQFHAYNKIDI